MNAAGNAKHGGAVTPAGQQAAWAPSAELTEALGGDQEILRDLIESFLTDTEARLARMEASLAEADLAQVRREAHSVKGSSRQIGVDGVADICQQVETVSTPVASVPELVANLRKTFAEVTRTMVAYLGNGAAVTPARRDG